jgi:hypothetical protein
MAVGGLAFGLIGDRRPFGRDMLAHPLVVFFVVAAAALLVLRLALARPIPELVPERALLTGCLFGGATYLIGNWIAVHLVTAQ